MSALSPVRLCSIVHSWSSLLCTLFLLLLCATGLPLIFRSEIDAALGYERQVSSGEPVTVDTMIAAGEAGRPGHVVQFVVWEPGEDGIVTLSMGASPTSAPADNETIYVEAATGRVLTAGESDPGPMDVLYRLHATLFAGPSGAFLLGLVALAFLVCLISGVLVYGPFMRFQRYGEVRHDRSARARELDRHKLVGITIAAWLFVVGVTGLVNGWGQTIFQLWRMGQLAELTSEYEGQPSPDTRVSVDAALAVARDVVPDGQPYIVAFPQSLMSSAHHFGIFMRGDTPQTHYRITPVLVDAATGELTAATEPPWYIKGLVLSQPLHFGDYGGLPLKILWAALDLVMIYLLLNGLYLWTTRRRQSEA